MRKIKDNSLYLVISEECCKGRRAADIARLAISGGVDIIQMREKDKPNEDLAMLGTELSRLCRESGATFIVNDDPALAREVGADGVHLGQEDIKKYPIDKVRKMLGRNKLIGISTHSLKEFQKANGEDIDYIAFGPIFPTKTKDYSIGVKEVEKVLASAKKPVFFIGGINLSNIDEILRLGAKNIAMIRGITEAEDAEFAARDFKRKIVETKEAIYADQDKR